MIVNDQFKFQRGVTSFKFQQPFFDSFLMSNVRVHIVPHDQDEDESDPYQEMIERTGCAKELEVWRGVDESVEFTRLRRK